MRRLDPRRLAWLPIPILFAAMLALWAADGRGSYELPYLLIGLNVLLSMFVSLFVAYLLGRSFLVRNTPGLLLLGCGVILWGLAGVVGPIAARGDVNISITIHNLCTWLSALCHLAGALLSLRPKQPLSPAVVWLPAAYAHAVGTVALITLVTLAGWIPTFFIQGQGGTPLRQVVLMSAIIMFAGTASLLGATHRRPMSAFTYWYVLALALIVTGLCGVVLQPSRGSILGWVARATQWLGCLYMLLAALAAVRESHAWSISLEEALRESEERYRALFETAPDAIIVHRDGRFLRANDAALRLGGADCFEELARHEVLDFLPPQERVQAAERARLAAAGRQQPIREATLRRLDGQEVVVELHTGPVDFRGAPAVQTIIRDITERKRAQEVLRIKDSAIGSSLNAIAMADLQGRLTYVNPAFLKLWRYEDEREVLGKQVLDFWTQPERALEVVRAICSGGSWVGELVAVTRDGVCRNLWLSAGVVRDDAGTAVCMMASFLDVTERKRAEAELKQALLDAQRRCAETSALMVCTRALLACGGLDPAIRVVFSACRELLGAQAGYVAALTPDGQYQEVLFLESGGQPCTVDPLLPMPIRGSRAEIYRTGQAAYENDFAHSPWTKLLPPGHMPLANVLFAPMAMDGRVIGLLVLGNKPGDFTDHDATLAATFGELLAIALRNSRTLESLRELNATLESKVAQRTAELERRARQLQKLTLELSQAEERERRRIAVVLHEDLQQQIAGAKMQLNLLSHRAKHDPSQRLATARIHEILKDAIGMSRSLSHELSPAIFYGNDLGEALAWLAEHAEGLQGLTVRVEVAGEGTLCSEALTIFLFRAARELLFNTVRHAGVREAEIRLRRMGRYIGLRVCDRGRGFDPQMLQETAGLGLLSIRERVELLGGRTKIRSAEDRGTAVRIVVPDTRENADSLP